MVKVFNATFNNISDISWRSLSLVEETEVSLENNQPAVRH
jgi:Leucine-rich repeat (LRR) protein